MDNLITPASKFYSGMKLFEKHDKPMDIGGRAIILKACERKHIQEAKQHSYMRRTYSGDYIIRDTAKRRMYLSDFDQLGARWVKDAADVDTRHRHMGWYTDDFQDSTLIGVVLCFARHGAPDLDGNGYEPKENAIYMAGTRHSDWDGVTLDLDTTDDPITAAQWANSMAEREAEPCREEDARYQAEQKALELQEQIKGIRTRCLKLLRDMRPIRKSLAALPESVYQALEDQVRDYCGMIRDYRNELKELT